MVRPRLIKDMVQAIHEDRELLNPVVSTRHIVEIIEAIHESGRTEQPVKLKG